MFSCTSWHTQLTGLPERKLRRASLLREDTHRPHVLGRVECPLDETKSLTCFDGMAYDWDFDVRGEEIREDSETATAVRRMCAARGEFDDTEDVGNDSESFGACWRLRTLLW
jgi:hypothetical protein